MSRDRCSNFVGAAPPARASVMNNSRIAKRTAWRRTSQSDRLRRATARGTYTWFLSCHLSICRQSFSVYVRVDDGFQYCYRPARPHTAFSFTLTRTCIQHGHIHISSQYSHSSRWCTVSSPVQSSVPQIHVWELLFFLVIIKVPVISRTQNTGLHLAFLVHLTSSLSSLRY